MKKNVVLIFLLLYSSVFASDNYQFCSTKTPNRNIKGAFSSLAGLNMLSRNVIENQIERAIKKETKSNFKIKIANFFSSNILTGEFKSLSAKTKRLIVDDLYLSNVKAKTICPYNKISFANNNLTLEENIVLKFNAEITQDDMEKIIESKSYKKAIEKLNNDKTVSKIVKIQDSKIQIKDEKLIFEYSLLPNKKYRFIFGSKPIKMSFKADLKVVNGKVKICNFDLNENISTYGLLLPIVNKLNPTSWKIDIDENIKAKFEFNNVKVSNSKIHLDGFIVVYKNI